MDAVPVVVELLVGQVFSAFQQREPCGWSIVHGVTKAAGKGDREGKYCEVA